MEFWGVEVKAGEPFKVDPIPGMVIHLSQACLGEAKSKGSEHVVLNVKVGEQKLVLGLLSLEKFPQLTFDLVFEQPFELSHNWKNGSIHFCGYQTDMDNQGGDHFDDSEDEDSEEEEETIVAPAIPNGKGGKKDVKANLAAVKATVKPEASAKPKAAIAPPKKEEDDSDDSEDVPDGVSLGSDDDSDEDMLGSDDSDEDDDDTDDESDEETPKKTKPELSKKRANDSASKTPVSKKAKGETPSKSDGKKVSTHTATPYPAKKGGKTPATSATADKSKPQTPKSAGVTCKSCSKTFGSEKGLESHTKAKHA